MAVPLSNEWQTIASGSYYSSSAGGTYTVHLDAYYNNVSGDSCTVHYRLAVNAPFRTTATSVHNSAVLNGTNASGYSASGGTFSLDGGDNPIAEISATVSGGTTVTISGGYYMGYYNWGSTNLSGEASVPTFAVAPSTPSVSASSAGSTSINVYYSLSSYGVPSSGTLYLQGSSDGSNWYDLTNTSSMSGSYTHTGLSPYHTYYYRAVAYNGQWSPWSGTASARTDAVSPSGLSVSIAEIYPTGAKFNVSISSYGAPSDVDGRYIEAAILSTSDYYAAPRSWATAHNVMSAAITVSNDSHSVNSSLTIAPNTQYYYGGYATNTVADPTSVVVGQFVTTAAAATVTLSSVSTDSATFSYSASSDGGYYTKYLQYSIDGGSTWITAATLSGGSASTGSFTVSNLSTYTSYTLATRVVTTAGTTTGQSISFTTDSTPPTGLTVTIAEIYPTGAKFNVSISSWGNPDNLDGRYIEAGICSTTTYGAPYKFNIEGKTLSADIIVTDTEYYRGSLSVQPNTQYYYGGYANNSAESGTGWTSTISGQFVTTATAPAVELSSITPTTATFAYQVAADGGYYDKTLEYSLDNGTTWITFAVITGSSATSGTFTVEGLTPGSIASLLTRVSTVAGTTTNAAITFKTPYYSFYGSVSGTATKITDFYGPNNAQTKRVEKLYGAVEEEEYQINPSGYVIAVDGVKLCSKMKASVQAGPYYKQLVQFRISYGSPTSRLEGYDNGGNLRIQINVTRRLLESDYGITLSSSASSGSWDQLPAVYSDTYKTKLVYMGFGHVDYNASN